MKPRFALLPLLAVAHASALLVGLDAVRSAPRAAEATAMASVQIPAPPVAVPVAAPPVTEVAFATDISAPPVDIAVTAAGTDDCAMIESLTAALRDDPRTPAALAAVPASARTVANALMLWDGHWIASAAPGAVERLRGIIVARVRATSSACQAVPVTGPRLVIVPDAGGTIVLAFGSGNWSWAEVAA